MNENNQFNKQNQAKNQEPDQAVVEASEFKTVVNGKVVSINQAQAAMEAQEANVQQTGIQEAQNNSSEPVQAGQKGKRTASSSNESARQAEMKIKQVNVQSGQKELEQHMNQGSSQSQMQSEAEKIQQEAQTSLKQSQTQASQSAQAKAKAKNQAGE